MVYEVHVSTELCDALARWIPRRDFATHPTHARALLTERWLDPVRGDALIALERELTTLATDFAEGVSWLRYRPPLGRGEPRVERSSRRWPSASAWEFSSACALDALTLRDAPSTHRELYELGPTLGLDPIDTLLVALLSMPTLEAAQTLLDQARTHSPLDRDPILAWLCEQEPRMISCEYFPRQALERAFAGRWQAALDVAPPRLRAPRTSTIRPNDEVTEITQSLAQLLTHGALGAPTTRVLDRSIAVLFGHWSHSKKGPSHSSTRVAPRVAALALHRALVAPQRAPIEALYAMRAYNAHLTQPIERRPRAPDAVRAAVEELRDLARDAIKRQRALQRATRDDGHTFAIEPMADRS